MSAVSAIPEILSTVIVNGHPVYSGPVDAAVAYTVGSATAVALAVDAADVVVVVAVAAVDGAEVAVADSAHVWVNLVAVQVRTGAAV